MARIETRLLLSLSLLLCLSPPARAEHIVTYGDVDIPIITFAADQGPRLLWLPSEFGLSQRRLALATKLAENGIETWIPDLHSAWFLPAGRYSLNQVEPAAISQIINDAVDNEERPLYLMAEGRTAMLALQAVRQWQTTTAMTQNLRGLLAFHPRLFARTPQGGEPAEYLPTAAASNLPIYLFQPVDSAGTWHIADDIRELEKGGAAVFLQRLDGVSDGFHVRHDFTDAERDTTRRLPAMLSAAMRQLDAYGGTPPDPAPMQVAMRPPEKPTDARLLRPVKALKQAPALTLPTLDSPVIGLDQLHGRVVLVNFWTTWCPPCVEEIPSLQRLYRRLNPLGLEILAVDVGESENTMRAFLRDKPVDFPVLMDPDGSTPRRWGVYAFPTTLVLDHLHRVRFAVFGALNWSSAEIIDTLRPLLAAAAKASPTDESRPAQSDSMPSGISQLLSRPK